ncbi:MAG: hypothetical protein AAGG46_04540, partial [Planctomycetota bacterium]
MASVDIQNALTIEAPSPFSSDGSVSTAPRPTPTPPTALKGFEALVEGSTPQLTGETRDLLRQRLFAASLTFAAAIVSFWVYGLFFRVGEKKPDIFLAHTASVFVVLGMTWLLGRQRAWPMTWLRIAEVVVFGGPAVLFVMVNQDMLQRAATASNGAYLPIIIVPWLLLIFTHALFIPNTWKRALFVLAPMSLAP